MLMTKIYAVCNCMRYQIYYMFIQKTAGHKLRHSNIFVFCTMCLEERKKSLSDGIIKGRLISRAHAKEILKLSITHIFLPFPTPRHYQRFRIKIVHGTEKNWTQLRRTKIPLFLCYSTKWGWHIAFLSDIWRRMAPICLSCTFFLAFVRGEVQV